MNVRTPCQSCQQRPAKVEVSREGDERKRYLCKPCYYVLKERFVVIGRFM